MVVNDHVDAFAAASGIGPRINLVEKMIFEVHFLVGTGIEDVSKRAEDAGGKVSRALHHSLLAACAGTVVRITARHERRRGPM